MRIVFLVCLLSFSDISVFSASVAPSTIVSKDTVWKSDTVKISSDLIINEKATLTINPGVVIAIQGPYSISVYGALDAAGNSTDSIRFIVAKGKEAEGWRGLHFLTNKKASVLTYCAFSYSRGEHGGAIYAADGFSLEISNCSFSNNNAVRGGAVYVENMPISIVNSRIFNCVSSAEGGGIYLSSCNKATLSGNSIYNNKAKGFGGGIYAESTKSIIQYNRIINNVCTDDSKGMTGGGGMALLYGSESVLNNVICNNETNLNGGGVLYISGNGQFVNNTVCNNKAGQGGGISIIDANTDTYNSIIWNNLSTETSPVKSHNVYISSAKASGFRNCLIKTGVDYLLDNEKSGVFINNIESNPLFMQPFEQTGISANALNATWLQGLTSPCVDAGYKSANITDFDVEGNPRVVNSNVDIGAYEFQQELVVSGTVYSDAIWYGKIKVTGDITIGTQAKLTILAGTQVTFAGPYGISANGQIIAEGEPQKPILFSREVTRKNQYPLTPEDGWKGIRINANDNGLATQMDYCIFEYCNNISSNTSMLGGAITCNEVSKLMLRNSVIRYSASDFGGAILALKGSEVSCVNSLFYGNYSKAGGVFNLHYTKLRVANCTLYSNTAVEGGVLYCQGASPSIENSILWNNVTRGGDQIYLADEISDPDIIYSIVDKGIKSIGGPGSGDQFSGAFRNNLDKNPLFNNPDRDNQFTLKSQSPCINAGNPGTSEREVGTKDLMGDSRFKQTIIDIGAYEYQDILLGKPVPDVALIANADTYTIDLSTYFVITGISNTLQYNVLSQPNVKTVTLKLNGNLLQITPQLNATGADTVIVRAESSYGADKTDTFLVKVSYTPLVLQTPFNNYRYKLNEDQVFKWVQVSISQAHLRGYVLKVVEIGANQSPEEAMRSNSLWYSDTINPASGNIVTTTIANKFPVYQRMAWQVFAINANRQVVGYSSVQTVYGAPLLASFYAGSNLVRVDTTVDHRLSNVSGSASIDVPDKGTMHFDFKNFSLISLGNTYYLNGGSVTLPLPDTIALSPSYLPNGQAKVILDSLYISKEGFSARSKTFWEMPVSKSSRFETSSDKISFNNFQLSGIIMLPGISSTLDALPTAKMHVDNSSFISVNTNRTYVANLTGTIRCAVTDRSNFMNDSVAFAFRNISTLDYFQVNSANQVPLGLNALVNVVPVQFFVDLSKEKSPFNYNTNWQGIAVNRFMVAFNSRNVDYPLSLTATEGIVFNAGPVSTYNISDGIKLRIDTTFSISIPSRFDGFAGSIKSVRIDKTGMNNAKDEISGGVVVPYIDDRIEHGFAINFNGMDYLPEMKPLLTDFSFYPYTEKSIDKIQIISGCQRYDGRIDQANRLIYFTIPDTINIKATAIYFIAKGNKVTIAESNIVRDNTTCDFSTPVVLRVYAGNGTYLDYVVTVLKNVTGISEPGNLVSVFPNPAQDYIKITGDNVEGSQVLIFDVSGMLKASYFLETSENVLPVSSLTRGLYILQIKKKDSVVIYRIIKE